MFPKLQSAAKAFDQLHHDLETEAEKFANESAGTRAHSGEVFTRARVKMAQAREHLKGLNEVLDNLDKVGNGSPTSEDSTESSETSGG